MDGVLISKNYLSNPDHKDFLVEVLFYGLVLHLRADPLLFVLSLRYRLKWIYKNTDVLII